MKNKDLLLAAGVGIAVYALMPKEQKEQLRESFSGGGFGFDLGGLMFEMPAINLPNFDLSMPDLSGFIPNVEFPEYDIPDVDTIIQRVFERLGDTGLNVPELPELIPDFIPDFPKLPSLDITATQTAVKRVGGITARQIGGSLLTGSGVMTKMPAAGKLITSTGKFVNSTFGKKIPNILTKIGTSYGDDIALKIAPRLALGVGKTASRAVPVIGWGLLLADLGADIARVFGANAPEWLGFSGLISAFTGTNPIENWHTQGQAEQEIKVFNPLVNSERGTGYTYLPYAGVPETAARFSHGNSERPSQIDRAYTSIKNTSYNYSHSEALALAGVGIGTKQSPNFRAAASNIKPIAGTKKLNPADVHIIPNAPANKPF